MTFKARDLDLMINPGAFIHVLPIEAGFVGADNVGVLIAQEVKPDIIWLSGLLTSSFDAMRETIQIIRLSGENGVARLPIIIGGNQLTQQVCQYVGADYWVTDAMTGVRLCQQLLGN